MMILSLLPPGYVLEIFVLLLPLSSIILFHTPTYNKLLSILDQIAALLHEFSSMLAHLRDAWKHNRWTLHKEDFLPHKLSSKSRKSRRKSKKHHKRKSRAHHGTSTHQQKSPRKHRSSSSSSTSSSTTGIDQETQVTPRELESIGVRSMFPMVPYYYRSLDASQNQVLSAYKEDADGDSYLPKNMALESTEVQTESTALGMIDIDQVDDDSPTPTAHITHHTAFPQLSSSSVQTEITGQVTPVLGQETKKRSFQICAWSSEVESVNFHSHVHRTVRRYLEQYIPCPSSRSHHLILTNRDSKLVLDRRSLRKIPLELIEQPVNLTVLDLSRNVLSELPDWFFETCKALTHLNLSYNYFYDIPYNFRQLKKLKELNLSHNRLQQFPQALCQLPNLTYLDVSYNTIGVIPNNIRQLRSTLTYLDISYNCLIMLPLDFVQLNKKLKYLGYQGNNFVYTTRSDILKYFESVAHRKDIIVKEERVLEVGSSQKPLTMGSTMVPSSTLMGLSPKESVMNSNTLKEDMSGQDTQVLTILELFENEQVYLRHLNVLFEVYYVPLTKYYRDISKQYDIQGITADDIDHVLPLEIYSIITFARSLFIELKEAMGAYESDPILLEKVQIGSIFSKRKDFIMERYIPYIHRYENSIRKLSELCKQSSQFSKYIQSRESLVICDGMELAAFLALPLQRLYFYHSVMRNLLKLTPEKHKDYADISHSVKVLSECLSAQKEEMSRYDNKYKIVNIEKKLNLELVKPGRVLVHEGKLTLAPTQELGKFRKEVSQHIKKKEKSTLKDKMNLNPYIDIFLNKIKDKTAGDVMNDLWSLRLTELSVYVYLFNDLLVIKENNLIQKLVSGAHCYELLGVKLKQPKHPEEPEFILQLKNTHNLRFKCETRAEAKEWVSVISSTLEHLDKNTVVQTHDADMELQFSDDEEDDISIGDNIAFGDGGYDDSEEGSLLESEGSD